MSQNSSNSVTGFRYSAINNMHECRLATWYTYKLKKSGFKNPYAKFGITIHDILEEYANHCIKMKIDTDYDEFDKIKLRHFFKLEPNQIGQAKTTLEYIKNTISFGALLQYDQVFIERRFPLDHHFNPTTDEEDSYLSGGMDVVAIEGDIAHVDDYKTVRAIYTKEYMRNSLQRKIYSFLIMKTYPNIMSVGFRYNFVRFAFCSEELFYTREQLHELEAEIQADLDALKELLAQEEPPEASPGSFCMLCESRALCPSYRNAFCEEERIETEGDAIRLFQKFKAAQVKLKAMEEMIKFWVETNKPIRIKDIQYGPVEEDAWEYPDVAKLVEILKQAGVPEGAIYEVLGTSKTKVVKLLKKFKLPPEITNKVDLITTKGKKTKFKAIKIDEEDDEPEDEEYVDPFI